MSNDHAFMYVYTYVSTVRAYSRRFICNVRTCAQDALLIYIRTYVLYVCSISDIMYIFPGHMHTYIRTYVCSPGWY